MSTFLNIKIIHIRVEWILMLKKSEAVSKYKVINYFRLEQESGVCSRPWSNQCSWSGFLEWFTPIVLYLLFFNEIYFLCEIDCNFLNDKIKTKIKLYNYCSGVLTDNYELRICKCVNLSFMKEDGIIIIAIINQSKIYPICMSTEIINVQFYRMYIL